jgi:hypothetical protein
MARWTDLVVPTQVGIPLRAGYRAFAGMMMDQLQQTLLG